MPEPFLVKLQAGSENKRTEEVYEVMVFSVNFEEDFFYRTPPGDCFCSLKFRSKNFHATLCLRVFCKKQKCFRSSRRKPSAKKMFLKISEISQKSPGFEFLFNKVAGLQDNYIKRTIQQRCFPVNKICEIVKNSHFEEHRCKATSSVL